MSKLCYIYDDGVRCREDAMPGRRVCHSHHLKRGRELTSMKSTKPRKHVVKTSMHNVLMIQNLNSSQYMSGLFGFG